MSELWLKDNKVLTLKDVGGAPSEVIRIDNPELLPISLKRSCTTEEFITWFKKRCLPENREGLKEVEEEFGKAFLAGKNYASLSDQYWIKMRNETWRKINYFTNPYSQDIGDMFFKPWTIENVKRIQNNSPDLTCGGLLKKRWVRKADGVSCLIKAGSNATHQEPLSEVLVSVLCETLGIIKCVPYNLHVEGTTMCSICDNFINQNTELVTAAAIYHYRERKEGESAYEHILRMAEVFEIPDVKPFLDAMILIDNITGNSDRNLGNIGFIRDVNTLKFIGPAPLYDSGNAYWNTEVVGRTQQSQTFGDVEIEICKQLKKQIDFRVLQKNKSYKHLIASYPMISEVKRENLIDAIGRINNKLVQEKEIEKNGFR